MPQAKKEEKKQQIKLLKDVQYTRGPGLIIRLFFKNEILNIDKNAKNDFEPDPKNKNVSSKLAENMLRHGEAVLIN
jgi:hypothetical protein